MKTEASLLSEIAAANTFREQASLVAELDALRASKTASAQADRDWDAAGTVVEQTLTPVLTHSLHTASTDWLSEADIPEVDTNRVHAEASLWFGKTASFVKADEEEFTEQAKGVARRLASQYGEQAPAAERAFLDYVAFLHRREAASGLDQIQQTIDPNNKPKTTKLPTDTFDTFQDAIDPINQGVDEMQSTENAPLLNEILSGGSGDGQPEVANGHGAGPYTGPRENGSGMQVGASLVDAPSVAHGYLYNLEDFLRAEAAIQQTAARETDDQEDHTPLTATSSADDPDATYPNEEPLTAEAASGLDQVEQVIDPNNQPKRTNLPTDVAFPLIPYFANPEDKTLDAAKTSVKIAASVDDLLKGDWVGDNPMLGKTHDGSEKKVDEPTNAMEKATAASNYVQCPNHKDQSYDKSTGDCSCGSNHNRWANSNNPGGHKQSSLDKTAASDYGKAARFAANWTPDQPIVRVGSAAFEAGLYAGITANAANQQAWLDQHEHWAATDESFAQRIEMHAAFTERLLAEGATTTDLDTMTPGMDLQHGGNTPLQGPGSVPPLAGGQDPAAPGGAAPYNGAQPFSQPVAPDPGWEPQRVHSSLSDEQKQEAFRQRVAANLRGES